MKNLFLLILFLPTLLFAQLKIENVDKVTHYITSEGIFYILPENRAKILAEKAQKGKLIDNVYNNLYLITEAKKLCEEQNELYQNLLDGYRKNSAIMLQKYAIANKLLQEEKELKLEWEGKAKKYKRQRNNRSTLLYTLSILGGAYLVYSITQN